MAKRKFTLARLLLRPVEAFKRAHKIFKSVELVPMVPVTDTLKPDDTKDGDYIVMGSVAFPAETYKLIKPSLMKVDYQFNNSKKCYYIPDDQKIYTNVLTADEVTAMRVARRFEEAS